MYWNRRSLHGTTTPSDSCAGTSGASASSRTPGAVAVTVVPSACWTNVTVTPPPRADAVPVPLRSGMRTPRPSGVTASSASSRPVARSSTYTPCVPA
ncbi:hypothetical protein RKD21_006070 [Streptomyces albogriseolus]|uniref:Uncharacterized protein n=1 Tax=Streptomyces albogriseolus TaxID=1887 RepID=A0ACC6UWT7_STRAO